MLGARRETCFLSPGGRRKARLGTRGKDPSRGSIPLTYRPIYYLIFKRLEPL